MARHCRIFRIALSLLATVACTAGGSSEPTSTGKVEIALNVGGGATLSNATYYIVAPAGAVSSGTVPVGSGSQVSVTVGPLPVATGYTLIVTGVASNHQTGCSGTTTFDITGGGQTTVVVGLQCSNTAPGQALVVGLVNVCPVLDGVDASPSSAVVGSTMALDVIGHDPDVKPAALTFAWSATGGATVSPATGVSSTLTCTAPGTVVVTVAASDGDSACANQLSFNVTCTELQ